MCQLCIYSNRMLLIYYLKILVNKVKVKSYILSPRSVDHEQTNEVWICRHGISSGIVGYSSRPAFEIAAAQNATMSLPGGMMAKDMIKAKIDQMRSEHPKLAECWMRYNHWMYRRLLRH